MSRLDGIAPAPALALPLLDRALNAAFHQPRIPLLEPPSSPSPSSSPSMPGGSPSPSTFAKLTYPSIARSFAAALCTLNGGDGGGVSGMDREPEEEPEEITGRAP